jgi:hypothetical protein
MPLELPFFSSSHAPLAFPLITLDPETLNDTLNIWHMVDNTYSVVTGLYFPTPTNASNSRISYEKPL